MAYGTPTNPVAGTVITVAYATANLLDPIRWLRLLTGNADPPGSSYVVVSTGPSGTSWQKVPTDAIADGGITLVKLAAGVVLAQLGYTPVNRAGDTMSGQLMVNRTQGFTNTAFSTAPLLVQSPDAAINGAETAGIGLHRPNASGVYLAHVGAAAADILKLFPNTGPSGTVWSSLNQGSGSGLDADTLRTRIPGSASGNLAILDASGRVAAAVAADTAGTASAVAAGSVTDTGVAAANKDGLTTVPSMRTLGTGAQQAAAGNHAHGAMAQIASSSYTGNGAATQAISVGFLPKLVFITRPAVSYWTALPTNTAAQANVGSSNGEVTITLSGTSFTASLSSGTNTSSVAYTYVAIG